MILEMLATVLFVTVRIFLGMLPDSEPASWFSEVAPRWSTLMGQIDSMGSWIPVDLAISVVASILACMAVALGIKITRLIVSLFTGGGGSAA